MKRLKWLATLPAIPGAVLLFFGLLWTSAPQLIWGSLLVLVAILAWLAPERLARSRP